MTRLAVAVLLVGCGSSPSRPPVRPPQKPVDSTPRAAEAIRVYVGMALETYRAHCGAYPTTLEALFTKPVSSSADWRGPYLEGQPPVLDPWGREFVYVSDRTSFKLSSPGPDGMIGTADDIGGKP